MKKNNFFILFLLFINIAFSQESDVLSYKNEPTKYQVGIAASRFISNIFPSDDNTFLLESRFRKNEKVNYRLGLDYSIDSSSDGVYDFGVKIGLDKVFKKSNKWNFYYGLDVGYKHTYLTISKKHLGGLILSPFLGVLFHISENFSISTEPNIYVMQKFIIDNGTFERNNKKNWTESGFGKLGFLQINFHF